MRDTFYDYAFGEHNDDYSCTVGERSGDTIARFGKDEEQAEESKNVKEKPLTKLDEYAILISKHWKRSKTGADDCDPTSILVSFKEDIAEEIKNELMSDGWTKTAWHKVADGDLPKRQGQRVWLCTTSEDYFLANY